MRYTDLRGVKMGRERERNGAERARHQLRARWVAIFVILCPFAPVEAAEPPPDFSRDVRPILADKCFACHGPDEATREAGLRLDAADAATEDLGGYQAIAPGNREASEVWLRITSDDAAMRMPPESSNLSLSDDEIDTLGRWIDAGARYEQHWAFEPPRTPAVPDVRDPAWCTSPIDRFVLAKLEQQDWRPSPASDRYTLVQRLYLDLTGLPPSPQEADAFVQDEAPDAYDRLVDRLLASPQYAEHWARRWLDLARYADTNGYEKDRPRSVWPYRDWVIDAINEDMPFDQFTVEQIAGDMLPDASVDQRVATGFHRMTMLNEEGGIDPLEYRFYAMVDRVATTGTVWMGLTIGCAQCHTHKYDPITHTDYYSFMALLNNADEPELVVPDVAIEERIDRLQQEHAAKQNELRDQWLPPQTALQEVLAQFERSANEQADTAGDEPASHDERAIGVDPSSSEEASTGDEATASEEGAAPVEGAATEPAEPVEPANPVDAVQASFAAWLQDEIAKARDWQTLVPTKLESTRPRLEIQPGGSILASGDVTKRDVYTLTFERAAGESPITSLRLVVLPHASLPAGGPGMAYYEGRRGDFFLSELRLRRDDASLPLSDASHSYGKISVGSGSADAANVVDRESSTGWSTSGREGESHHLIVNLQEPLTGAGTFQIELLFERHFAAALGHFRIDATSDSGVAMATTLPAELADQLVEAEPTSIPPPVYQNLQNEFLRVSPLLAEARKPLEAIARRMPEPPTTLVMRERPEDHHRATHRHHRGEYLSPREEVSPRVPEVFPGLPEDVPADRLQLAEWLVSDRNPLAARVVVNRAWRNFFGHGIVRTAGDFGTQSDAPTHPQLLDYLATETVSHGWSMKRLHREIVMSSTYRQSSLASADRRDEDPENRLLARGPRFRRSAEVIRDSALKASGLLTSKIGGPSVRPPQPDAVMAMAYGGGTWNASSGADRYRRSLYTFKKRTAPFAAYAVFDAPTGENCVARRDRSNTPLQSLTLLNDEMFLEMARHLAERVTRQPGTMEEKVTWLFREILVRPPEPSEHVQISGFYQQQHERLVTGDVDEAAGNTDKAVARQAEQQAWFLTARALMNVDEFVAR